MLLDLWFCFHIVWSVLIFSHVCLICSPVINRTCVSFLTRKEKVSKYAWIDAKIHWRSASRCPHLSVSTLTYPPASCCNKLTCVHSLITNLSIYFPSLITLLPDPFFFSFWTISHQTQFSHLRVLTIVPLFLPPAAFSVYESWLSFTSSLGPFPF